MNQTLQTAAGEVLRRGVVIPAHPLALTIERRLDERRQRALARYYIAAGSGGLAVGVHTTQFAIRDPRHGLYRPVLQIAAEEMDRADAQRREPLIRIAGVCGRADQALGEVEVARALGYQAALLSPAGLGDLTETELIDHVRRIAAEITVIGFYLQPAVGGRVLGYDFWRRFAEIDNVAAVKIAPFNRYQTLDVVRAIAESGREDIALYTGNDDNIVADLLTPFTFEVGGRRLTRRIVGGLLGHWAVWTKAAVDILARCHALAEAGGPIPDDMLRLAAEVTDMNAAVFDAANGYAGVIAGVHEVLRRQGLMQGTWCLDPNETLSPGQADELTRTTQAYPHLSEPDNTLIAEHRDAWLADR